MLYIVGVLFALLLTLGQACWKVAVDRGGFELTADWLLSKKALQFLYSPALLAGLGLYVTATLINMWLLTKYDFSHVQAVAVPIVLVLSFLFGALFFKDSITLVNFIGMAVIIGGVFLATAR